MPSRYVVLQSSRPRHIIENAKTNAMSHKKFIAVIGCRHRVFRDWERDNKAPVGHTYIFVDKEEMAHGRYFDDIITMHDASNLHDFGRLKWLCELRLNPLVK